MNLIYLANIFVKGKESSRGHRRVALHKHFRASDPKCRQYITGSWKLPRPSVIDRANIYEKLPFFTKKICMERTAASVIPYCFLSCGGQDMKNCATTPPTSHPPLTRSHPWPTSLLKYSFSILK